jgi:hypothetical protein
MEINQSLLFAKIEQPTPEKIRSQICSCDTLPGEFLLLEFEVVSPCKLNLAQFDALAAELFVSQAEAAKDALGRTNEYRMSVVVRIEKDAPEKYVRSFRVYKQGDPRKRRRTPVHFNDRASL